MRPEGYLRPTALGYYEIWPKPTRDELRRYYSDQYYANPDRANQYSYGYTAEELEHKTIAVAEAHHYAPTGGRTLFEIGCGEGFFLKGFSDRGWIVEGVDFTDDGLQKYHPELREFVVVADVFDMIDEKVRRGGKYDFVACNNVLEHVIDPIALLEQVTALLKPGGVCRISVPNDGSWLQHEIVRREQAAPEFWLCPPGHLNYFSVEALRRVLEANAFFVVDLLTEFPVDVFLLNPDSNYQKDRALGRNCHFARVAFERALYRQSLETLIEFRRGCARAGVGRNTIAYCRGTAEVGSAGSFVAF